MAELQNTTQTQLIPVISPDGTVTQPPSIPSPEINVISPPQPPQQQPHTWKDGVTRQTEIGYAPDGWVLKSDGFWYPPADDTGTAAPLDLRQYVRIEPNPSVGYEVTYIKNSGMFTGNQTYTISNTTKNMSIRVAINAIPGVIVEPQAFELHALQSQNFNISFNSSMLDTLPEGENTTNILINLSAGTITTSPDTNVAGKPIAILPPPPPDVNVVTNPVIPPTPPPSTPTTWKNGVTRIVEVGTPPTGWILNSDGYWYPATTPSTTISVDFSFKELAPTYNSSAKSTTMNAAISSLMNGDDITTYTLNWNFDVDNQGRGVLQSQTLTNPVVGWLLTATDINSVQSTGQTSRVIELIATKGANTIRIQKKIVFSSPALLSNIPNTAF